MSDILIGAKMNFSKGSGTPLISSPNDLGVNIAGQFAIKNRINVGTSDEALDLADLPDIGWCLFENIAEAGAPDAVDPVITQAGTPGTTHDTYVLVFHYSDGSLSTSIEVQTVLANATLDGTNYNILTWTNPSGVSSVDVYRTEAAGSPSTLGKISTGATSPYHDIGGAGDGNPVPDQISSLYEIEIGHTSGTYTLHIFAGQFQLVQWNQAAIHVKSLGPPVTDANFQYLIAPQ